jgi:hypothetical protein
VIKIEETRFRHSSEPRIYGVRIYQEEKGAYTFCVRHSGQFRLGDYEELELEVKSARLVRRNQRPITVPLEKAQ